MTLHAKIALPDFLWKLLSDELCGRFWLFFIQIIAVCVPAVKHVLFMFRKTKINIIF